MANAGDDVIIPPNADQALFAEDLVNFVLHHQNGTVRQNLRYRDYRAFAPTVFDEELERGVIYMIGALEWVTDQQFSNMVDRQAVNIETFVALARRCQIPVSRYGLEPNLFLLYCVALASLASCFERDHGTDVFDDCVDHILAAFPEHDMQHGGWEAIRNVARRFRSLSNDVNNHLTPDISDIDSRRASPESESEDEDERNVYSLRTDELEIEQSEDSLPFQKNDENEDHNCIGEENDLNHSSETKLPSGGNPDHNSSEYEMEGAFAQKMLHNEVFRPNCMKGSPSKNTFKQEDPQFDGRIVQSTSRCSKLSEFVCLETENRDLDKHEEEIDSRKVNQGNIHIFIRKLQKLAAQKRNYERESEQAKCALKRMKSVDVGVSSSEDCESSGEISNLHRNGEGVSEGAFPNESRMLTESMQLITHDAPNKNVDCASRDSGNCSEGVDFTKTGESSSKTISPSVLTLHEQDCLSEQNNELNLRCSSPDISCKTSDSVGG